MSLWEHQLLKPGQPKPKARVANAANTVANAANGATCPHCGKELGTAAKPKRDRKAYMRELMRKKRAKEKP